MRFSMLKAMIIGAALAALLIMGCEEQKPPEGQMKCDDASECPSGWYCDPSDNFCYAPKSDGGDEDDTETSD